MTRTRTAGPKSCADCLAWGDFAGHRWCNACRLYRQVHRAGLCGGCGRASVPVKTGWCRMCRMQLSAATFAPKRGPVPPSTVINGWQLMLATPALASRTAVSATADAPSRPCLPLPLPGQFALFPVDRDYTLVYRHRRYNPANLTLIAARDLAARHAEQRGWPEYLQHEVDLALRILLSDHAEGDLVRYSRIPPLDKIKANVCHTCEILQLLGILDDDRAIGFTAWLDRRLAPLTAGIADDVRAWATHMHRGSERSAARAENTVRSYLTNAHPLLVTWSAGYEGLRQVTGDDIRTALDTMVSLKRKRVLVALRSLFGYCKKNRRIFRDPTSRIQIGQAATPLPLPLHDETLHRAAAAATTPAQKLVLALAALHAARPGAITQLTLDDLDLPNRQITIAGHPRRLDDLTHLLITDYLKERRYRWPHTANRHLLLTERTAHDQRPASTYWLRHLIPQLPVPLNKIRMDRQLEEAMTCGPDPLRLSAIFGIAENTAVRYATAARQLLESEIEQASNREPTTTPTRTSTNQPGSSS